MNDGSFNEEIVLSSKQTFNSMKLFVYLSLFLTSLYASSQAKKVLFIGNSYTSVNNLPALVQNLAMASGRQMLQDSYTPGGRTLQQHSSDPTVLAKIKAQKWDFVVLQDQSQLPSFPDQQVEVSVYPYAKILVDSIRSNFACTVPLFYDTWGRQNGDSQWVGINTFEKMNFRLYNAYTHMADVNEGMLSPVGMAFLHIKNDTNSPIAFGDLYQSDESHPTIKASYLAACIFNNLIYSTTSVGNTFIPNSVLASDAAYLQAVADHVTYEVDSIKVDHRPLSKNDFSYLLNGSEVSFNAQVTNGNLVAWLFGDDSTSTDLNPTHIYANSGTYTVSMITKDACYQDTISYMISLNTTSINSLTASKGIIIYPNPSMNGKIKVENGGIPYKIYSLRGEEVFSGKEEQIKLDSGYYILKLGNSSNPIIVY